MDYECEHVQVEKIGPFCRFLRFSRYNTYDLVTEGGEKQPYRLPGRAYMVMYHMFASGV